MNNNLLIVPSETDKTLIMVPVQAVKQDLITKTDYLIYVPLASKETFGTVKIGEGLSITNGVLSIDPLGVDLQSKVDKFQGKEKHKQALVIDSEGYVTTGYAKGSIDVYRNASIIKEESSFIRFSDDFNGVEDDNGSFISLRNPIPLKTSELTNDGDGISPYATLKYVLDNGGKIDSVYVNNVLQNIVDKSIYLNIPTKLSDLGIDKPIAYEEDIAAAIAQHNTDNNAHLNIQDKLLEVEAIAKGKSQAISYENYMYMVNAFNTLPINEYCVGQSIFIDTLNVPDLWISKVEDTSEIYGYTSDEAIINLLKTNGNIRIGYYVLSPLETEKVDLTNYVNLDGIQTVRGIKTFTEMIGLLNSTEGEADFIKHINNNFLITSHDGKSLLNIDEQLEKIYSFNKELANKDYVKENYLSFTEQQTLSEEQQALIRSKIGAGSGSFSGSYKDLSGIPYLNTNNSASLVPANEELLNTINLHKVSKTGLLSDLSDDINHRTVTDNEKNTWNNKLSKNDILKLESDVDAIDSKLGLLETSYKDLYSSVVTLNTNQTISGKKILSTELEINRTDEDYSTALILKTNADACGIKFGDIENNTFGYLSVNKNHEPLFVDGNSYVEYLLAFKEDIPKLYDALGQNSDGSITQKIITNNINNKVEKDASNLSEENIKAWKDKLNVTLPIGFVIYSSCKQNNAGLHLADGSELAIGGTYNAFCQYVIDNQADFPITDLATYQTELDTYGQCGKYVITDTYVKLPKITKQLESANSESEFGTSLSAGLPNITGALTGSASQVVPPTSSESGALSTTAKSVTQYISLGGSSANRSGGILNFDASQSNSIYGNSDTVQPQTTKYYCYIVVGTVTKTDIVVNIDNIATDVNNKADKSGANVSLLEALNWANLLAGQTANATAGYLAQINNVSNVGSYSGYVQFGNILMQWGRKGAIGGSKVSETVTLYKPYASGSSYSVVSYANSGPENDYMNAQRITNLTATSFSIQSYFSETGKYAFWFAIGFAPEE